VTGSASYAAAFGLALAIPLVSAQPGKAEIPWRGWDQYQVILWSVGEMQTRPWLDRVREAGYTAEQCSSGDCGRFAPARLGFYVENMVPELAFLHQRNSLYQADWKGYSATGDKRYLTRKPCLDDPAFWAAITPRIASQVRGQAPHRPLLYDLRDEPSLGSFVSPMDYCFCPYTLRAFRKWLQKRYGSLDNLNREWESSFATWNDVVPLTTFEIKQREKSELAGGRPENFAPWADHREYMDVSFARAIDRLRGLVHQQDPQTPVGIAGAQMPSAWGGYDLWRMAGAVDWIEPYDIGNSRAILQSFLPPRAPVLATYFGSDIAALRHTAWRRLLDGDRGAIVWDDEKDRVILSAAPGMPATKRGTEVDGLFREIRAASARLSGSKRVDDRIAIHYSQASIRAHWMFDSREDGNTWYRRLASYEQEHSRLAKVRDSFVKVVEDVGRTATFVSYEQIENGELIRQGYKVLLLPQSVAMSAEECRQIEAFVQAGGVVIADNMAATMDEHCRRLKAGQLDELFGVRQKLGWKPSGDRPFFNRATLTAFDSTLVLLAGGRRGWMAAAPMAVEKRTGKGRAIYLNLDMHDYGGMRGAWAEGEAYRSLFDSLFQGVGLEAPVRVSGGGVLVKRFARADGELVALLQNRPKAGGPSRIHVTLSKAQRIRQESRELGTLRELDVDLGPSKAVLLELGGRQ
jgi:hypothetical protein